ncbi:MAG TPA: GntR family transcriptional regulator [Mesorhizobium sp.]|jgi:GntR family transcriptional regulator|nr:GntR family transcriptional regulator [Mesorhizobium sp.]
MNLTSPVTSLAANPSQPESKPLYLQIKELLVQRIAKGEWGPGELLPSEMRLASEFGVHQGTVRKALDELAARNLVVRHQGKGTFVSAVGMRHNPYHFFRMRPRDNVLERPTTEFLSVERGAASAAERETLRMDAGWSEVVRAVKLRKYDGKPIIVERIAYPADLFPGLDELLATLRPDTTYGLLEERYRVLIARVSERLSAIAASTEDAALLGAEAGKPLLGIDRLAIALDGRPAEWRVSHCSTDDYEYFVEHH